MSIIPGGRWLLVGSMAGGLHLWDLGGEVFGTRQGYLSAPVHLQCPWIALSLSLCPNNVDSFLALVTYCRPTTA